MFDETVGDVGGGGNQRTVAGNLADQSKGGRSFALRGQIVVGEKRVERVDCPVIEGEARSVGGGRTDDGVRFSLSFPTVVCRA